MSGILIINPGSTSTKVGYYENGAVLSERNLDLGDTSKYSKTDIFSQLEDRLRTVEDYLQEEKIDPGQLDAIASRGPGGGNFKSGAYEIDQDLVDHCYRYTTPHASSLGPVIAKKLHDEYGTPALVYDAEGVNEFTEYAKLSGQKEWPLDAGSHTLSQKAAARETATRIGKPYEETNLIVCHMGGGVSTAAHCKGKIIDSLSNAYTPERMGGMSLMGMIRFTRACYSGQYDFSEIMKLQWGNGGLVSYLGTSDLREVEERISAGDKNAAFYFEGMAYQLAQDIGAVATILEGKVDRIVLTGGMAYSERLVSILSDKVGWIADIVVLPGSLEMISLAKGVERALSGEEPTHHFSENPEWVAE